MLKCNGVLEVCGKDCCCHDCFEIATCGLACKSALNNPLANCEFCSVGTAVVTLAEVAPEAIKLITNLLEAKKEIEEREKLLRVELLKVMEKHEIKKFTNDVFEVTYVAPTTRTSIDSTKLKKLYPEIAEQCSKISNVSASLRMEVF